MSNQQHSQSQRIRTGRSSRRRATKRNRKLLQLGVGLFVGIITAISVYYLIAYARDSAPIGNPPPEPKPQRSVGPSKDPRLKDPG